jgi:hypothetical protein
MHVLARKFPRFVLSLAVVAGMLAAVVPAAPAVAAAPSAPSPRSGMGVVYDAARSVVLFGGEDGNNSPLDDTWTWDGTAWTKRTAVHHPEDDGT